MTFPAFLFYFFAAIQVSAAIALVFVKNPVYSALFLVLTFVAGSGLWLLLEAEFLGIVLVLVYVGAVMVLFLFVVMMLDINVARMRAGFIRFLPGGLLAGIALIAMMSWVLRSKIFLQAPPVAADSDLNNTRQLGELLYTQYVFQFELAAVILLVAIVAAISLTLRRRPGTKHQNISAQVKVRREDRIRLVKMKTEKN